MQERPIFEIAIYRCSQDDFATKYEHDRSKYLSSVQAEWKDVAGHEIPKQILLQREDDFWKSYGSPWQYNQAVEWLRLVVIGTSIRGQLWKTRSKQFQRIRCRQQIYLCGADALEVTCFPSQTSEEIREGIHAELVRFQKGYRKGKLFLDYECFDAISAFINWRALLGFK